MKSEIVQNQMNHLNLNDSTSELNEKISASMVIMDFNDNSNYYEKIQEKNSAAETRPHNLEELVNIEGLVPTSIPSTFSLDDLSDDDEIWLMDMPKRVNPKLLDGQVLSFTDKSKIKIGDEFYTASRREVKENLTCVFSTAKGSSSYKMVNIKPAGMIRLRQKLTVIPKKKPGCTENTKIPLPQNIRHRDPHLGVVKHESDTDQINCKVEKESITGR